MRKAQREVFLRELAVHGIVRRAAQAANPNAKTNKGAARAFYDERRRDLEFAQAWDDAVEEAGAAIESEIHRRGVEGFEEQRVDSNGRITVLRRYSDPCLLALARARLPQFRKSEVELSGRVEQVSKEDQRIADAIRQLANSRAPEATHILRDLAEGAIHDS